VVKFYEIGNAQQISKNIAELRSMIEKQSLKTMKFYLGTDAIGRDLLSRLMIGTRISLTVGLVSVIISLFIGIFLGALAGYYRGWVDTGIMWLINVVWSIPTLLLVIAITLVLGKGIMQVFIAVGLTMWVETARVVRGQILSIREKEFVDAGRALGFKNMRIITRHVLSNVMGPVVVMAASNFAAAILTEAGLSFLGIGAQPPVPSWGEMSSAHYGYILLGKAYLAIVPGIATALLVLAFMLVGNGLRDALDTRNIDDKAIAT
jgi:peptide/nickel transport system permease protein